jgi:hypothetical protein
MTKIVHIKILDGTNTDVEQIRNSLKGIEGYKFLITNDKIEIRDIGKLLEEVYTLFKQYKKVKGRENKTRGDKNERINADKKRT